jgi:hypothetical protein
MHSSCFLLFTSLQSKSAELVVGKVGVPAKMLAAIYYKTESGDDDGRNVPVPARQERLR